jgi:hypothetical protein
MKLFRYSGIRLDPSKPTYEQEFETVWLNACQMGVPLMRRAQNEPYIYQDHLKSVPLEVILRNFLRIGELYVISNEGNPVGYALFREILPRHKAKFEIYLCPEYRKTYIWKDLLPTLESMAFDAYPNGLELKKLSASVHPQNTSSLKACVKAGFMLVGESLWEALFNRTYTSMMLLDLYPPKVRELFKPQVIEADGRRQHSISKRPAGSDVFSTEQLPGGLYTGTVDIKPPGDSNPSIIDVPECADVLPERLPVGTKGLRGRPVSATRPKHVGKSRRTKSAKP